MKNGDNEINKESWFRRFVDNTSLSKIIKELVTDIKDWVEGMITGTLYLNDGNWFNYIKPRPELKNVSGSYQYGYWIDIQEILEDTTYTNPSSSGNGLGKVLKEKTDWSDFLDWIKIKENQPKHLISMRCCELVLPSWARTVVFGCNHVNIEYLVMYPPKFNRALAGDNWTNNENCNGYRIAVFQLPADGMYVFSPSIKEGNKNVRRVLFSSSEVDSSRIITNKTGGIYSPSVLMNGNLYLKHDDYIENRIKPLFDGQQGMEWQDKQSIKSGSFKVDGSSVTYDYNEGGSTVVNNTNFNDWVDVTVKDLSSFVRYITNSSDIDYYSGVTNSDTKGFCLKPGCVADMVWFNGFWYAMGTR